MSRRTLLLFYAILLIALVVGVDVLFFRHHLWPRLLVNIGIVVLFAAIYLRFLKTP